MFPAATLLLFAASTVAGAQVPAAITTDQPRDAAHPAALAELTLPSHNARLNAVFYLAAGAQPHPTVLLLHGFPGNEQNLDLAQAMRRAGWNVLTFHYRGSWGSSGDFSFLHAIGDTDAALDFLRDPGTDEKYRIDPKKIVAFGHSMGGFLALHAASSHAWLAGVGVMSAWNIGGQASTLKTPADEDKLEDSFAPEMPPLAGCTAHSLVLDARQHAEEWNYVDYAPAIHIMPAIVLESQYDGLAESNIAFAAALRKAGDAHVTEQQMPTDHSFSDHRIALETAVLNWLARL